MNTPADWTYEQRVNACALIGHHQVEPWRSLHRWLCHRCCLTWAFNEAAP